MSDPIKLELEHPFRMMQVSARRYVVVREESGDSWSNLRFMTGNRLGQPNEMIQVRKTKIISRQLDHQDAKLLYAALAVEGSIHKLADDLRDMLLD